MADAVHKRRAGLKYSTGTGVEGQFQPGSRGRVLRNLRGVTRKREMDPTRDYRPLAGFFAEAIERGGAP
jgi:hypothetical protein